jgi:hypothetical protein
MRAPVADSTSRSSTLVSDHHVNCVVAASVSIATPTTVCAITIRTIKWIFQNTSSPELRFAVTKEGSWPDNHGGGEMLKKSPPKFPQHW